MRHRLAALLLVLAVTPALASNKAPVAAGAFKVCADPNNMPYSNAQGQGFENKLAILVAHDLGQKAVFVFQRQTDNFLNRGLKAHLCDAVMGLPTMLDDVAVTKPYYASTYVFVSRARDQAVSSLADPRLRRLKIGVHLVGDNPTPPAEVLGEEGIVNNVHGFMVSGGDYGKPNPPARLIEAVTAGTIDVAAVWGPIGGYYARLSPVPLKITPMAGTERFAPLVFQYAIGMGVRKEDAALKARLNEILGRERETIHALLASYGVPLVSEGSSHE